MQVLALIVLVASWLTSWVLNQLVIGLGCSSWSFERSKWAEPRTMAGTQQFFARCQMNSTLYYWSNSSCCTSVHRTQVNLGQKVGNGLSISVRVLSAVHKKALNSNKIRWPCIKLQNFFESCRLAPTAAAMNNKLLNHYSAVSYKQCSNTISFPPSVP